MTRSKRLNAILSCLEKCDCIADIGADHGHLDYYIILDNLAKKVIATDISAPSIAKTAEMAKEMNITSRIETRVGDGLKVINPFEADVAVIAGMGGKEISKILLDKDRVDGITKFVLQPAKYSIELRKFLLKNKFFIEKDFCVFENGKFYDTIVATCEYRKNDLTDIDIYLGKDNLITLSDDFLMRINKIKTSMIKHKNYLSQEERNVLNWINNKLREI